MRPGLLGSDGWAAGTCVFPSPSVTFKGVKRAGLLAVLGGLFLCAPAQAVTIVGPAKYQRWADRSYVPTPKITVQVTGEPCPDAALGCSYLGHIQGTGIDRDVFLYELGHQFDYALNGEEGDPSTPMRNAYRRIIGRATVPWSDPFGDVLHSPDERFAADYMRCAENPPKYLVSETRQTRRACALIERIGAKPPQAAQRRR
jgi:hypothetical protein